VKIENIMRGFSPTRRFRKSSCSPVEEILCEKKWPLTLVKKEPTFEIMPNKKRYLK
jgi:hypothetical protein